MPCYAVIKFMGNQQDALIRSDSLRLLSACFYEPDRELFLDENVCLNLGTLLSGTSPEAATAAKQMHVALTDTEQQELILDYAALFVGPFELIAAPFGSVYLEKNRRLMGDSTIAIKRYYTDEGVKIEVKQPPDHIAVELEFMSLLSSKEASAIRQQENSESNRLRSLQSDFFTFAMSWIPQFCDQIQGGAQTPYYRALGECLGHFHATCQQIYS